jgi:hypothetical protein
MHLAAWAGILVAALLLALVSLASPRVPAETEADTIADASWSAVLGFAHEHSLQFGTDIVFTYGPLGFLATPFLSGGAIGLRLAADVLLGLAMATGLALLAWRMPWVWRALFLATGFFLLANISPRNDLLLELALVSWALLAMLARGRVANAFVSIFLAIAVYAALVKVTLLLLAGFTVGWLSLDCFLRDRRRLGIGIALFFAGGLALNWMLVGQHLTHLPEFLRRAFATSDGYNAAMGYEGSLELRRRGIITALAAAIAILCRAFAAFEGRTGERGWRGWLLSAWLLGVVFLVWKHGFVRTDPYHAGFYFGFVALLVLGLEALPVYVSVSRMWGRSAILIGWMVAVLTVQAFILPREIEQSLLQVGLSAWGNLRVLVSPSGQRRELLAAYEAECERLRLPAIRKTVGESTIDMFGAEQLSVLCNRLNYQPRPVFQSYAAYSPSLMQRNQRFYASTKAPEFVLFRLSAMDRKFPPLEDSWTLRHLLTNYEPVGKEDPFLLLRSRGQAPPQLKLLREGTVAPGEKLGLEGYGEADLWLEMSLRSTFWGRILAFAYQPPKTRLVLYSGPPGAPRSRRFRAPAPMLASGFLISPLLINNEDVLGLYQGREVARPSACAIELTPDSQPFWQRTVAYRLYHIESRLGGRAGAEIPPARQNP